MAQRGTHRHTAPQPARVTSTSGDGPTALAAWLLTPPRPPARPAEERQSRWASRAFLTTPPPPSITRRPPSPAYLINVFNVDAAPAPSAPGPSRKLRRAAPRGGRVRARGAGPSPPGRCRSVPRRSLPSSPGPGGPARPARRQAGRRGGPGRPRARAARNLHGRPRCGGSPGRSPRCLSPRPPPPPRGGPGTGGTFQSAEPPPPHPSSRPPGPRPPPPDLLCQPRPLPPARPAARSGVRGLPATWPGPARPGAAPPRLTSTNSSILPPAPRPAGPRSAPRSPLPGGGRASASDKDTRAPPPAPAAKARPPPSLRRPPPLPERAERFRGTGGTGPAPSLRREGPGGSARGRGGRSAGPGGGGRCPRGEAGGKQRVTPHSRSAAGTGGGDRSRVI